MVRLEEEEQLSCSMSITKGMSLGALLGVGNDGSDGIVGFFRLMSLMDGFDVGMPLGVVVGVMEDFLLD